TAVIFSSARHPSASLAGGRHSRLDMASRTLVSPGLFPVATTRHVMSRSVITPIGFKFSSLSTTATSPQSCLTIISAACCTVCSGVQQTRWAIITSLPCFMDLVFSNSNCFYLPHRNSHFERLWPVIRQAEYTIRELLIKGRIVGV